jgi:hypothetical protein
VPGLPPTAVIHPAEQRSVTGVTVRLDGRASTDPEGDALTYAWSFISVPLGSLLVDADLIEVLAGIGTFSPDVHGPYVVGLIVNDGTSDSPRAEGVINVGMIQAPTSTDILPDGRFFFKVLSDFWIGMEDHEALTVLWSSYVQQAAAELLNVFQMEYNKSIVSIQDLYQKRWEAYEPLLPLIADDHYFLLGNRDDGVLASTGSVGEPLVGVILSDRSFVALEGSVREANAGETLQVLTSMGANAGSYTIDYVGRDLQSYVLRRSTSFPAPAAEILGVGPAGDLASTLGSAVVRSATVDFSAVPSLVVRDGIQILSGIGGGVFQIEAIGVADGLPDNNSIRLSRPMSVTGSHAYTLLASSNAVIVLAEDSVFTDVVSVPLTETNFENLRTEKLGGAGTILGTYEIRVGTRFAFSAAVGRTLDVYGSPNSGRFTISAVTPSGDGYYLDQPLQGPFPQTVTFSLPTVSTAEGRIILVNGRAYTIRRVKNSLAQPDPPLGPGPLSLAILDRKELITGLSSAEWRVPHTLVSKTLDFEELGVSSGDVLLAEVTYRGTGRVAEVRCTVVGVDRSSLGFEITTGVISSGAVLDLTEEELESLADTLGLSGADRDGLGNFVLDGDAEAVNDGVRALQFSSQYHNLPVERADSLLIEGHTFTVTVQGIIRNRLIPVDTATRSIPSLRQYIATPFVSQQGDLVYIASRDGVLTEVPAVPVSLVENRDYIVDTEADFVGRDGAVTIGLTIFTSASGMFLSRNVDVGDTLTVQSVDYSVVQVLSETQLQVLNDSTGEAFLFTDTALPYTLERRVPGTFVRFVDGSFSVTSPAPDRLWAEVTFLDNSQVIEDNFGLMVSFSEADLSSRNTSSTTYREAVLGLMYAWANGPKEHNIRLGVQILLGLPVADVRGRILSIKEDYTLDPTSGLPSLGRILVEDLDQDDQGTGLVRIYFFPPLNPDEIADFAGIETNPTTGNDYQEGDVVERFAALSKGVVVSDYINDPDWWKGAYSQGATSAELQKFHSWSLRASVNVINPDDLDLAAQFVKVFDPAWVDVVAKLVKPLTDDIEIEDDLTINGRELLVEDLFPIESTARLDDNNGFGYPLNFVGAPPLMSRQLFAGWDMVTPDGAGVTANVTSARGGFINPLANPPHPAYAAVNTEHGTPLVRPGDLLYLPLGSNAGWYEVDLVVSDSELRITQHTTYPFPAPGIDGLQVGTEQHFFVYRVTGYEIMSGAGDMVLGNTLLTETTSTCFFTEGVAVDDILVVDAGANREVYTITEMLDPGVGVFPWTQIRLTPTPVASTSSKFKIFRPCLRTNPLLSGGRLTTVAGSNVVTEAVQDFDLESLQTYDELYIESGADEGTYQLLDVISATELYVRPAPTVGDVNARWRIRRKGLSDGDGLQLNRLVHWVLDDELTFVMARPRAVVGALTGIADVTASGKVLTSAATNFQAGGAVAGQYVRVVGDNPGVYQIDSVLGSAITLFTDLQTSGVPATVDVLDDDPVFSIAVDTVTYPGGDLVANPIAAPGDIFEILDGASAGQYIIAEVTAATTFDLTNAPVVVGFVTGRLLRVVR